MMRVRHRLMTAAVTLAALSILPALSASAADSSMKQWTKGKGWSWV
jgi:hypothetical protein